MIKTCDGCKEKYCSDCTETYECEKCETVYCNDCGRSDFIVQDEVSGIMICGVCIDEAELVRDDNAERMRSLK